MKLSSFILGLSADETTHFVTAEPACLSVSDSVTSCSATEPPAVMYGCVCGGHSILVRPELGVIQWQLHDLADNSPRELTD